MAILPTQLQPGTLVYMKGWSKLGHLIIIDYCEEYLHGPDWYICQWVDDGNIVHVNRAFLILA